MAGLLADARSLADVAKEEASGFRSNYGYDIPLKVSEAHAELPIRQPQLTACLLPAPGRQSGHVRARLHALQRRQTLWLQVSSAVT